MVHGQQRACMPVYIGKSGDLVGCYRCLTDTQTSEYRATQLVSSIKHKLSHAIISQLLYNYWKLTPDQHMIDFFNSHKVRGDDCVDGYRLDVMMRYCRTIPLMLVFHPCKMSYSCSKC